LCVQHGDFPNRCVWGLKISPQEDREVAEGRLDWVAQLDLHKRIFQIEALYTVNCTNLWHYLTDVLWKRVDWGTDFSRNIDRVFGIWQTLLYSS
jgi:hypothetical protein